MTSKETEVPDDRLISWKTYEFLGSPVYKYDGAKLSYESGNLFSGCDLKRFEDLELGMQMVVPSMSGYRTALVHSISKEDSSAMCRNEGSDHVYFLSFNMDDRHCWVCHGSGNINSVASFKIS